MKAVSDFRLPRSVVPLPDACRYFRYSRAKVQATGTSCAGLHHDGLFLDWAEGQLRLGCKDDG